MKKIGIVAGSFDPITNGHMWLIKQACYLMDELFIVVGVNPTKKYIFDTENRVQLVKEACSKLPLSYKITVTSWDGLLVQKAAEIDAQYIIRGIRSIADFTYEQQMQQINKRIDSKIDTLFLIPPPEYMEISSSTVKSLVGFPGWENIVEQYVPGNVLTALKEKQESK